VAFRIRTRKKHWLLLLTTFSAISIHRHKPHRRTKTDYHITPCQPLVSSTTIKAIIHNISSPQSTPPPLLLSFLTARAIGCIGISIFNAVLLLSISSSARRSFSNSTLPLTIITPPPPPLSVAAAVAVEAE
jgi:hypothetical protein